MGLLQDAGESFIKYSEIIVNKTEKLTKIAKLKLDIKKIEYEIDKVHKNLGIHIVTAALNGAVTVEMNDPAVKDLCDRVADHRKTIAVKNSEVDEIKKTFSE